MATATRKKATRKKAAPAKRPRNGAQKQFEADGFKKPISKKLQGQLEADRDACADKAAADVSAKAARESLIATMEDEDIDEVNCPFRDKKIELVSKPTITIKAIEKVDQGA